MTILKIKKLTRRFGKLLAVDSLNISVRAGEVFGLLGPNGAGKTTAIKMLTTLLPPTSGTVTVAGFDFTRQASEVRRMIGYVPQILSADGSLTGYENLLVFARLYDLPRKECKIRVRESLDFMGLTDAADRLVRTYSGGMIRRMEIAQSMLHQPRVLFLDEPTVGLDPLARKAVWKHIEELRANYGTTIFLTTHYLEEADALCSRIAVMHLGKMVALGTSADLKASIGGNGATLNEVFAHYTSEPLHLTSATGASCPLGEGDGGVGSAMSQGKDVKRSYSEISRTRRNARRLG